MPTISRDALTKYLQRTDISMTQRELAQLRLDYSKIATLRNTFIASLRKTERIYPTILPIQAGGRWSYIKPPLSGFPKDCINPECPEYEHEKTSQCWSVRDCIVPDINTFWIEHDLDAVEHKIYALILDWKERIDALKVGIDIHTPVTCDIFGLPYPSNLLNPHTSIEDATWRVATKWRGKDDQRRTMSKNFTYGQGQYCYVRLVSPRYRCRQPYRVYGGLMYTPTVVYLIPHIEKYRILNDKEELVRPDYEALAIKFMESNIEIQKRKAVHMERIRKDKIARTLYGGRRRFFFSNQDTAKQGWNFFIQGTVASYINESVILLQNAFPTSYIVHNQHDSLKWAFQYESNTMEGKLLEEQQILTEVQRITQRDLCYRNNIIPITATYKITRAYEISC